MMTEMEERVARALALAHKDYHAYARPWALLTKSSYGEDARAAIAAVRAKATDDPDNNILQAGFEAMFVEKWDGTQAPMMGAALDAMLDAILGPPSAAADPGIPMYRFPDGTPGVLGVPTDQASWSPERIKQEEARQAELLAEQERDSRPT